MHTIALCLLSAAGTNNCRQSLERDCNAPHVFSNMTITAKPTKNITIIKSYNWDASGMDGPVQEGLHMARKFLGHTEPTRVYLLEPGGTDADYADLKKNYCAFIGNSRAECMGGLIDNAKKGIGTYQVSGRYLAPADRCSCNEFANPGVPLIMIPRADDSYDGLRTIASHEYVHTWQKAMAGPVPEWWMEGGAEQIACLVGTQNSSANAYRRCFEDKLADIIQMYTTKLTTNWLKLYGENRPCDTAVLPGAGPPPNAAVTAVWYKMGAFGLAFAVHAANLNRNLTAGGPLTTRDMWLSVGDRGMWRNVQAYHVDRKTGWASSVPEGAGWRKALCDFTGFANTSQFYDALHAAVVPNGVLATKAQLLTYLEEDGSAQAQAAVAPSYTTPKQKNACPLNATQRATIEDNDNPVWVSVIAAGIVLVLLAVLYEILRRNQARRNQVSQARVAAPTTDARAQQLTTERVNLIF